jgi:hypothetical protein
MCPRILVALFALAFIAAAPRAVGAEDEVNFDYFYSALQNQGDWFGTDKYGYVFQPRAAAADPNWRPYADGYWSFTDEGWTWISYEDFGWATYHYGRWAKLSEVGWVWVPGFEWAPAWVSWRTSPDYSEDAPEVADQSVDPDSDYIGWAPLPPEAMLYPGVGFVGGIDEVYEIPPENYCFVPTPYLCAPALIAVIVVPSRNYFFIGRTINVTHCRYGNHRGVPRIFCGGPNFGHVQRRQNRPIPQFTIERRAGMPTPGRGSPALMNQVNGNRLQVTAPRIAPPPGTAIGAIGVPRNATTARPEKVKAEIARAERVRGWNTPGIQPQVVQAAREQISREAAQSPRRAVVPASTPGVATRPIPGSPTSPITSAVTPPNQPARARRIVESPGAPATGNLRDVERAPSPSANSENPTAPREIVRQMPADQIRRQQAAELGRRQQIIAEQQRRAAEASGQPGEPIESPNPQSQSEAQARMQALRAQQLEQARQAQANAQAQRQQQIEAQRQAQADRQRQGQAEAQARAEAQREAMRQQQQAEQQRRAAEAQRRTDTSRGGQGTSIP